MAKEIVNTDKAKLIASEKNDVGDFVRAAGNYKSGVTRSERNGNGSITGKFGNSAARSNRNNRRAR
jgi:hypothetical protein